MSQLKKRESVAKDNCAFIDVGPELLPNNYILNNKECKKAKEENQKALNFFWKGDCLFINE